MKRPRPGRPDAAPTAAVVPALVGSPAPVIPVLAVLFVLSGASGLMHELLWFNRLGLVVGSSAVSLGILLATYMGGLGLGSLLAPKRIPRHLPPGRVYAGLEVGIALLSVLVFFGLPLVERLYASVGAAGPASVVLRAMVAGLCLLPPTVLMGATLPAVARAVSATPSGASRIGLLYTCNLIGAIVGTLWAGFELLRRYDMVVTLAVASGLGLVAAALAWVLLPGAAPAEDDAASLAPARDAAPLGVRVAIALSGAGSLAGQVVWTRILSLLLGATVYTFSIILGVFLFGLGLGSALGSLIARTNTRPVRALAWVLALQVIAIPWAAYASSVVLPLWPINYALGKDPWIFFQMDLARSAWVLLPPTLLWGASFPLAIAACTRPGEDRARSVASVYVANTLGAIVGALGATFLIPLIGTHGSQRLMVLASVAGALAAAMAAGRAFAPRRLPLVAAGLAAAALLTWKLPAIPADLIALGRYMVFRLASPGAPKDLWNDPAILFAGEGLTESVAVSENAGQRVFHVSGKIEASSSDLDMRLQRMLGHLPALAHGDPRSVLIVGCGAGVTAGTFASYPGIERIVICEIEPMVPQRVTPYFSRVNHDVLNDPRVQVVYDDARHFILSTKEKFDLITSDPIHPWVRGSGALYSRDYYELVKQHLNPGGVVSQWLPLYQASPAAVRSELATFFAVYGNGTVWAGSGRHSAVDLVMLGGRDSVSFDLAHLQAGLAGPERADAAASLAEVGFGSVFDLFATYAGRARDLAPWLQGAPINRDMRPWLQYQAGWDSYTLQRGDIANEITGYRRYPVDLFTGPQESQRALIEAIRRAQLPVASPPPSPPSNPQ